jgi:hypothetical protein
MHWSHGLHAGLLYHSHLPDQDQQAPGPSAYRWVNLAPKLATHYTTRVHRAVTCRPARSFTSLPAPKATCISSAAGWVIDGAAPDCKRGEVSSMLLGTRAVSGWSQPV